MPVTKKDLEQFMAGHARANEVIAQERRQRLARLTVEQARQEYDELCAVWEASYRRETVRELDTHRLKFLVERRERFNRIGGWESNP